MSAPAVAAVREHQILFSGPMVRAILDGRKTQTRRVLARQPGAATRYFTALDGGRFKPVLGLPDAWDGVVGSVSHDQALAVVYGDHNTTQRCPYGAPGDRLWVREAIRLVGATPMGDLSEYEADGSLTNADGWPWKRDRLPGIFCPRGLSRLTLEVTGVRVERVRDICSTDARAEGLDLNGRESYRDLWDSLNKARGYGWDVNPWVWVIDFTRVAGEGR